MPTRMNLNVDLQRGVIPISKAASSLAALIKRADATGQPVIVTQKGYPTGVLLPIGLFTALKSLADDHTEPAAMPAPTVSDEIVDVLPKDAALPAVTEEVVAPEVFTVEPQRPVKGRRKRTDAVVA